MACLVKASSELEKRLELVIASNSFSLRSALSRNSTLPSQPRVSLNDELALRTYLRKERLTPDLDGLFHRLWLVSTTRSSHISALHHQAARGREIIVAENPQLHLVWSYYRIFIQPIPSYMLSHAFWAYLQATDCDLNRSCTGFMRTYSDLIRCEIDFHKAVSEPLRLIPSHESLRISPSLLPALSNSFQPSPGSKTLPSILVTVTVSCG